MGSFATFYDSMDWWGMLSLLITVAVALISFTIHELCHGAAAYQLGDPTAKNMGRLTLNPIRHIDPFGLILILVAHVGWAKPVPVDMRNFKNPKRGMALTALAGPVSNLILAFLAMLFASILSNFASYSLGWAVVRCFASNFVILNVGLAMFNLIPISPLDGSKILFSVLPDKMYFKILKYERFVMIPLLLLVFFGFFDGILSTVIVGVLSVLSSITGVPVEAVIVYQDLSNVISLLGVS